MPDGTQPFPRVPYSMNKGQQLNTVTSQVIAELGWRKFDFHHVLSGYIEDCKPVRENMCSTVSVLAELILSHPALLPCLQMRGLYMWAISARPCGHK